MGTQREQNAVPADINVRVVPGSLGEFRHAIYESNRNDEVFELERARYGVTAASPVWTGGQGPLELWGGEFLEHGRKMKESGRMRNRRITGSRQSRPTAWHPEVHRSYPQTLNSAPSRFPMAFEAARIVTPRKIIAHTPSAAAT